MKRLIKSGAVSLIILVMGACEPSRPATVANELSLDLNEKDGQVSVTLQNGSPKAIVVSGEPMIGFSRADHRLKIVVYAGDKEIQPCAHLDPPLAESVPSTIQSGSSESRSVSLELIRRIYCLNAGRYHFQANYSKGATTVASSLLVVDVLPRPPRRFE